MPYKTGIRLLGVARNPANGFPARLLAEEDAETAPILATAAGGTQGPEMDRLSNIIYHRGVQLDLGREVLGQQTDLNQSQGGIYIDTGLARAANAVIPANAGIQESFCSFRLRKLTHRRSPKQTLGFG